jgi:hypothetical protein
MYRTLFFVIVSLLAVNPVSAAADTKLTNAELKQLTSNMFFCRGVFDEIRRLVSRDLVPERYSRGLLERRRSRAHCQEQVVAQRRYRLRQERRLDHRKVRRVAQERRSN